MTGGHGRPDRRDLTGADINVLSLRAAMGLPESYGPPLGESIAREAHSLVGCPTATLAQLAEDASESLVDRLAAGILLAILGDPRINVLDPAMVDIPAGPATIGTDSGEVDEIFANYAHVGMQRDWILKEVPCHQVTLKAFRLGRYLVTNAEYAAFLAGSGQEAIPPNWAYGRFHPATANQPVMGVSAQEADAYAAWLSSVTGRQFRLPREVEWERAAAGPARRRFPWGDVFLPDCANTVEGGLLMPTPVGIFPAGAAACGALDMAGNVEEYVADDYAPYPRGVMIMDDLAITIGSYRVARGGAFCRFADLTRCARRHGAFPSPLYPIGFRLAEEIS